MPEQPAKAVALSLIERLSVAVCTPWASCGERLLRDLSTDLSSVRNVALSSASLITYGDDRLLCRNTGRRDWAGVGLLPANAVEILP
jgi:hypothetical protein